MGKLNAKKVENAAPRDREYKLHDGGGLFLRVRSSGAKSWLYAFSLPNDRRLKRMTLGNLDDISLKEARALLPELHRLVSQGIDPRNARAAAQAENAQAVTMQVLFDAWIDFLDVGKTVSSAWVKRHRDRWRLHLRKRLGNLFAKDVTRAHLSAVLDAMTRKGVREETRKALTTLNLMLDYGLTRHLVDSNPARLLKPKDFAATASRPRSRALSLSELRGLWRALDEAVILREGLASSVVLSPITATAFKMLILTGARRSEVAGMRWAEMNLDAGVWVIPAERTKNGQAHTVYLGSLGIELIRNIRQLSGSSEFVFSSQGSLGHLHPDSMTTALNRLRKSSTLLVQMKPHTIHDIRRSAATAWGEHLKVLPHVTERMLNHQPLNRLVATYQRAIYADEQRAAWLAWDEMVRHQVSQELSNVVVMREVVNR